MSVSIESGLEIFRDVDRKEKYAYEHPSFEATLRKYSQLSSKLNVFEDILSCPSDFIKAKVVAKHWYQFSRFVASWLCLGASKVSSNNIRHYAIQTAFEELGMNSEKDIHADMFASAIESVGVYSHNLDPLYFDSKIEILLDNLFAAMQTAKTDGFVLGLFLGLEIPAKENIGTVFRSLCYYDGAEEDLAKTKFFKIHFQVEAEHIQLSIANFLRFSAGSKLQETEFDKGFKVSLNFWNQFWKQTLKSIKIEEA